MPTLAEAPKEFIIYKSPSGGTAIAPNYNADYDRRLDKILTRAIRESEYWRILTDFARAKQQLRGMANLRADWDSYGAEPPSEGARSTAGQILNLLESMSLPPTRIVPSAEGGVGICFVQEDRYADIECLNSGEILAVTYIGTEEPRVWEIAPQEPEIRQAIERIRGHITA